LILQTISKPVKTLEDVKGIKIRSVGVMTEVIKALGGVPVPLEMVDVYDSLRRGVIEGVTVDLSTLKYWKFAEVTKYVTADWQLGTGITFYWVMSKRKWNALSPDISEGIHRGSLRGHAEARGPVGSNGYRGEGLIHKQGRTDDVPFRFGFLQLSPHSLMTPSFVVIPANAGIYVFASPFRDPVSGFPLTRE
jgi:hypothetical protein